MDANTPDKKPKIDYELKPWKIGLIAASGIMIVTGAVMALVGSEPEPTGSSDMSSGGTSSSLATTSFVDGSTAPGATDQSSSPSEDQDGAWSPALLRGGISFFVAFCLAFAFRTFLRLALIFIGVWGASLFFLDQLGWIQVHWDVIDHAFSNMSSNIGAQFESARSLITGSLPSAGLAGLGLFTGFKKG